MFDRPGQIKHRKAYSVKNDSGISHPFVPIFSVATCCTWHEWHLYNRLPSKHIITYIYQLRICGAICDALLKYVYDFIISLVTYSGKHTRPSLILDGGRRKCDTIIIFLSSSIEQQLGIRKRKPHTQIRQILAREHTETSLGL